MMPLPPLQTELRFCRRRLENEPCQVDVRFGLHNNKILVLKFWISLAGSIAVGTED